MNNENMTSGLNQLGQQPTTNMNQGNIQSNMGVNPMQNSATGSQPVQGVNQELQTPATPNMNVSQNIQPENINPSMNVSQNIQPENINPNMNVSQNSQPESINPNDVNQEQPKYGYGSNENKESLNDENKSNLKFVIILAILMLAFIILLPYLSNLL